jgi:hypothetical protein
VTTATVTTTPRPGEHADLYVNHDDDLEGLDVARLRPGRPALPEALATHVTLPPSTYDITRLAGRILAMSDKGSVALVDPINGKVVRSLEVTPQMLDEPTFTSLILDETESTPDQATAYVAGRFGRPGQRAFAGFVIGFDSQLKVTTARTFDDVVQNLAADAHGAVALLTEGAVVDAVTGATLRQPTYARAKEAMAVRRTDGGLWIAVGERGKPFLLTPKGKVVLPTNDALPIALVAIPGGVAVVSQGVDAVYIVTGTQVRTVTVPQTGAGAVLVGSALYILSAGNDTMTRINLSDLTTAEYAMPPASALVA